MTILEAAHLADQLRKDPSTAICAAVEGWAYPIDRTTAAVLDLFDLTHQVNSPKKKPKPHPGRPWLVRKRQQIGNTVGRTTAEVKAILARLKAGGGNPSGTEDDDSNQR